ncbi:hypothetical protein ACFL3A_10915 [Pseudomonadota bacterium]
MKMVFSILLIFIGATYFTEIIACEDSAPCDKCEKESEYSWNPNNRYVTPPLSRFYSLEEESTAAYTENDYKRAEELLTEYLELARIYRCNWNYGNAIHDANRLLGLISLKIGNIDQATNYLLESGKSTGSPQLDTFGPEMDLANELLKLGRHEQVKTYLKDVGSFWEMDDGLLDQWIKEIDKGEQPELNRFSAQFGFWQQLIVWLSILWPLLITAVFLYALRRSIGKKLIFGIVGIVTGYIAMFIVNWVSTPVLTMVMSKLANSESDSLLMPAIYAVMSASYLVPVLAIFGISRTFLKNNE